VPEQSTASLTRANISGTQTCAGPVIRVTTARTFAMSDSLIDSGDTGIQLFSQSGQPAPQVTITNTIVRNMKGNAMGGGDRVALTMTGGALSNNGRGGFEGGGGEYSFAGVMIQENSIFGIYYIGNSATLPAQQTLKLRGCTVSGQPTALYLDDNTYADLGTTDSPGTNQFLSVQSVGVYIGGGTVPRVDAVGNVWRPDVQGADGNGMYPASTPPATGLVPVTPSKNYAITRTGVSLYL
jgi:hypothetical protein